MDIQTFNVAALSGLNIRNIMSLFGTVIERKPHNASINIDLDGFRLPAVIDNLIGNWVQVADSQGGFVFDGYLIPERMPNKGESITDYANSLELSSSKHETELEIEESFILPDLTVQQAFLIARVLFDMSPQLLLPPILNEHNVIEEALPYGNVWEEQLSVSRNRWELSSINYTRIYEGGAVTGTIVLVGDDGVGVEVILRTIAD